jgi:hypothetical protein
MFPHVRQINVPVILKHGPYHKVFAFVFSVDKNIVESYIKLLKRNNRYNAV